MAYDGNINPIPDESRWPEFESQTIEPPVQKTKAGRPKKKRTRAADEQCVPNATFSKRCSLCGVLGHNRTTWLLHIWGPLVHQISIVQIDGGD
ncbi:hypothetical protein Ddye_029602 [Dipteronia dyeriana]|uniref:Uncharacterized protein n=1 Tax=Dipteronia dyeriana TaxID=168575 RepID=A0AAD9TG03_9ROSI|nr:hypothetical protein Ddye_029602 [Dipteronia dyeriana]